VDVRSGQSLDWLVTGDVASFITGAAAVSAHQNDAELVDLVNQLFEAEGDWNQLNLIHDRMEGKKITGKLKRNRPVRKPPSAR
jgi:hypothetical protein